MEHYQINKPKDDNDTTTRLGLFLFFIVAMSLILTLVLIQPIELSIDAKMKGNLGSPNSTSITGSDITIPNLSFSNPINGKEVILYDGTTITPELNTNISADIDISVNSRIRVPIYVVLLYYITNHDTPKDINNTVT